MFFCVPTCTTLQKINGFFISSTGAGIVDASLSKSNVWPPSLAESISSVQGDLGCRMGYSAFIPKDLDSLRVFLQYHINATFEVLTSASNIVPTDILFFGIRLINEISYKFISLFYPGYTLTPWQIQLKSLLTTILADFESKLFAFINHFNPDNTLVVSDHGIKEFVYEININQLLCDIGVLRKNIKPLRILWKPYQIYSRVIMQVKRAPQPPPSYALHSAPVYSVGFTDAIYSNQKSNSINSSWIPSFQDAISSWPFDCFLQEFPLPNEHRHDMIHPSYRLILPDGATNTCRLSTAVHHRDPLPTPDMFQNGFHGEHSGCKSQDGIFSFSSLHKPPQHTVHRLQDVYHFILSLYSS